MEDEIKDGYINSVDRENWDFIGINMAYWNGLIYLCIVKEGFINFRLKMK